MVAAINSVNPSSCLVGALLALASGKAERRQVHPLEIVSDKSVVKKVAAVNPINPLNPLLKKVVAANPLNPINPLLIQRTHPAHTGRYDRFFAIIKFTTNNVIRESRGFRGSQPSNNI